MNACIVVPVYRGTPSELERLSLRQLASVMRDWEVRLAAPTGLATDAYPADAVDYFPPRWFHSRKSYNALMVSPLFYSRYETYEAILIHQTDAFVFADHLQDWLDRDIDFVGAPHWAGYGLRKDLGLVAVGNGGFSLRRPNAFLEVLRSTRPWSRSGLRVRKVRRRLWGEDIFWGAEPGLRVAAIEQAVWFAFETGLELLEATYGERVPFGCHADWNLRCINEIRQGTIDWAEWGDYGRVLNRILEACEH